MAGECLCTEALFFGRQDPDLHTCQSLHEEMPTPPLGMEVVEQDLHYSFSPSVPRDLDNRFS